MMESIKGLFKGFDTMVTPKLMTLAFWIGIVLIGLGTLSTIIPALIGGSIGLALLSLLSGALGVVLWRVACEMMIVIFKIHDRLGVINEDLKSGAATRP